MLRLTTSDRLFTVANYTFLTFLLLIVFYPLLFVVSASVSDPMYVNSGQLWLFPRGFSWEGYRLVFRNEAIWSGFRNSLFYTVAGVLINLFVTLPCAYALSRTRLAGRHGITFFIVFTMFFSGGLIPTFLLVRDIGIMNSVWAMLLPVAASVVPIIITKTFFQSTIPQELEEAAKMDGSGHFHFFFHIAMPLSGAIIAVMALFYGVSHWNQYFNALIYLSSKELYPLQLVLREILVKEEMSSEMALSFMDDVSVLERTRMAEVIKYSVMIVAALPLLIVYPFVQKYFVKGVLIGSLKE